MRILPRENKDRRKELERLKFYPETLLFYEAPHRIAKTLEAIREEWGDRRAVLARELTKRYEEFARGTLDELIRHIREGEARGEYCLVVEGFTGQAEKNPDEDQWWMQVSVVEHVDRYCEQGFSKKEAIKQAADDRGVSKRDVYNEYHREMPL